MTKIVKFITETLPIVGGIAGLWGAYTAWDASKFRQPFDEHDQVAKSYRAQITSAENRKDAPEANRVRLLYEKFEERWRAARQIAQLVAPIESLAVTRLTVEQSENLKSLVAKASEGSSQPSLPPKTLGAAYFAIKDFEGAVAQLNAASNKNVDPKTLALKASAYSELASTVSDARAKSNFETAAVESYSEALKATKDTAEISGFAVASPSLKAVLDSRGIELTNR